MTFSPVARILGFVVLAVPAAAQADVPLSVEIDGSVSAYAESMTEGVFDAQTVLAVKSLTYQKAVAISCAAFVVDDAKFQESFGLVFPPAEVFDALPEDEQMKIQTVGLLTIGTFLGMHLAVAEADKDGFCANAEAERDAPQAGPMIWMAK